MHLKNEYIGIPFSKMDCWQLVCHYYKAEFKIMLPAHEKKYKSPSDRKAIEKLYEKEIAEKTWLSVKDPQYPDIAVFKINGSLWHCGIIVGKNKMLHTQRGCDSVIERYNNARWENRLYGFYRYRAQA